MTIELQTGLPGHGKTLYTLDRIEQLRKKTGRPVFYSGIAIYKDKLPEWQELEDPKKWFECPPEAIVVIDEAQRIFRPRASGSAVPPHVEQLETHRHGGIDLLLMTQRPALIENNVRELVGRHLHIVRTFGMQRATVHEWGEIQLNTRSRANSIKHMYSYNRKVYGWYKSSEAHTYKVNIPMKVWALGAIVLGLPIGIYAISRHLDSIHSGGAKPQQATASMSPVGATSVTPTGGPGRPHVSEREYIDQHKPRVPGLAYTAPIYDEVTKPVRAPVPAACVQTAARCHCYSQQATRLEVPLELCRSIVAGGFFVAWDERTQSAQVVPKPSQDHKLEGGSPGDHISINPGYQPQRVPFQSAQSDQVEQDPARPRANRGQGG